MAKTAAAVVGIVLLVIIIVLYGLWTAAGILQMWEAWKGEDAEKWQETGGAGREKRRN
ncbi:MAG: hypothetical protein NC548_26445 [Lachnospiraceae bacterium]|nr:hypothetical protein [Lachnospiraceae bacterium]